MWKIWFGLVAISLCACGASADPGLTGAPSDVVEKPDSERPDTGPDAHPEVATPDTGTDAPTALPEASVEAGSPEVGEDVGVPDTTPPCTPKPKSEVCAKVPKQDTKCGLYPDGCGGTVDCGDDSVCSHDVVCSRCTSGTCVSAPTTPEAGFCSCSVTGYYCPYKGGSDFSGLVYSCGRSFGTIPDKPCEEIVSGPLSLPGTNPYKNFCCKL